jgi:Lysylphosphatidylglycerol synthase TM region
VNTFVPARAGDAVRVALFSRALDDRQRLWRTGGAFVALEATRAVVFAALAVAGIATGVLPLWPLLALLGLAAAAAAIALRARRCDAAGRVAHLLDALRTLGREPARSARLVGWVALSAAGRVAAAAAVGAALGISQPLAAALVIVPALDVAGTFPLTPGNLGITSGAVAVAFRAHGISFTHGLAAGIAFQAVETAVGLAIGLGSIVWLAPYPTPGVRRIALLAAGASASLAVAGAVSATVLIQLV